MKTKQQEIGELIDAVLANWNPNAGISGNWHPLYGGASVVQDLMLGLHSKGACIKVEPPKPKHTAHSRFDYEVECYRKLLLKAGYVAVESLI
ncbi:hypothetical protein LCGC14_0431400 [marine sediment metagenome]|uniref:Uncharacterized protein n=1 Tax=marine sediment metagenome TaxID=412755 RepID=A0A0F9SN47_9ZZZZ